MVFESDCPAFETRYTKESPMFLKIWALIWPLFTRTIFPVMYVKQEECELGVCDFEFKKAEKWKFWDKWLYI